MAGERPAQGRVGLGRGDQGVKQEIPVALAQDELLALPDQVARGVKRTVHDEGGNRRVGERRRPLQDAFGVRVDPDLDPFGLGFSPARGVAHQWRRQ